MDAVFNFEDFFNSYISNTKKLDNKINGITESITEDDTQQIEYHEEEYNLSDQEEPIDKTEEIEEIEEVDQEVDQDDDYFKLYKDKTIEFKCNIQVEGSLIENTEVRLLVESDNWKLVFDGEILNNECIIPINKLSILNENEIGNIKLEVITEGSIFVPWEDKFKIHTFKKVMVSLDESLSNKKKIKENKIDVRVNFK